MPDKRSARRKLGGPPLIAESGLRLRCLETTEDVLIGDFSRAVSILRHLKVLGIPIAMDDFGTGYSSFSYPHALPFHKIKIDRAFISNLDPNLQSAIICADLDAALISRWSQMKDQLAFLSREACHEIQGYLVGDQVQLKTMRTARSSYDA